MKISSCPTSACRYCHHYQLEGRRGGTCQQLGVPVQGAWKACALGKPAFTHYQEMLEQNIEHLEHALGLEWSLDNAGVKESQAVEVKVRR
jgi:hypothetical protein